MPESAVAGTLALLLAATLGGGVTVSAQEHTQPLSSMSSDDVRTSYYARNDLERRMQHELVCTCGACGHANIGECRKDACPVSHKMRGELAALIDKGQSREEIINWFVTTYDSQEMLGAPLNQGFNRLAWLFPYLVGGVSAAAVGFAAIKWSRRGAATEEAPLPTDPSLEDRLDDELRNLD
jgi:cytochrome c-type biogenesis protein CcmH/NrfF